ncbi:uncharacterized protein AMSG_06893 [Thecamonas trahens ATCC 50062]|uniref:Tyrosine-protein kinase ephrin type A/B receptor-like domain-containing protein n=1 Tax=Thecamonas trahens ATCC 50062 TaxID=461836 RepID=A0A0L0DDH7_THETB|nr:hypothetical protein AMSG_06893 [Thecamonas trahens ATCC 50062]KNC50402.1 hypothetical protein AMSG_06893 [Thecamonas trahens ATCC 50062]|eukprot:XP_013756944.1 hypothetical protein AMSG_06893 [Thecamonas trahens ATCC 50062]
MLHLARVFALVLVSGMVAMPASGASLLTSTAISANRNWVTCQKNSDGSMQAKAGSFQLRNQICASNGELSAIPSSTTGLVWVDETSSIVFSKTDIDTPFDVGISYYNIDASLKAISFNTNYWKTDNSLDTNTPFGGTATVVDVSDASGTLSGPAVQAMIQAANDNAAMASGRLMIRYEQIGSKCSAGNCKLDSNPTPVVTINYYEVCPTFALANGVVSNSLITSAPFAPVGDALSLACNPGFMLINAGAGNTADADDCGVCFGNGTSCRGCDGVIGSPAVVDECGVCDGTNECLSTSTPFSPPSLAIAAVAGIGAGCILLTALLAAIVILALRARGTKAGVVLAAPGAADILVVVLTLPHSDELQADLQPSEFSAMLDSMVESWEQTITVFGGTAIKRGGRLDMIAAASFGRDASLDALMAALAVHDALLNVDWSAAVLDHPRAAPVRRLEPNLSGHRIPGTIKYLWRGPRTVISILACSPVSEDGTDEVGPICLDKAVAVNSVGQTGHVIVTRLALSTLPAELPSDICVDSGSEIPVMAIGDEALRVTAVGSVTTARKLMSPPSQSTLSASSELDSTTSASASEIASNPEEIPRFGASSQLDSVGYSSATDSSGIVSGSSPGSTCDEPAPSARVNKRNARLRGIAGIGSMGNVAPRKSRLDRVRGLGGRGANVSMPLGHEPEPTSSPPLDVAHDDGSILFGDLSLELDEVEAASSVAPIPALPVSPARRAEARLPSQISIERLQADLGHE